MMKSKAWLMFLFTLSILAISVCLPTALFYRQETRLLKAFHTEKLDQPSKVQIPVVGIREKLALISDANLSDSNIVILKTSGHTELSTMKEAVRLGQDSLAELSSTGLIPGTDLSTFSINEFSHIVYSDISSQASVSCYSFWANGESYDIFITIDADTGSIYGLRFISFLTDSDFISLQTFAEAAQSWGEHLGVSFVPIDDGSEYDTQLYQIEHSNLYYLFSRSDTLNEIYIQLLNSRSLGIAVSEEASADSDDTTMMEN